AVADVIRKEDEREEDQPEKRDEEVVVQERLSGARDGSGIEGRRGVHGRQHTGTDWASSPHAFPGDRRTLRPRQQPLTPAELARRSFRWLTPTRTEGVSPCRTPPLPPSPTSPSRSPTSGCRSCSPRSRCSFFPSWRGRSFPITSRNTGRCRMKRDSAMRSGG